MIPRFLTHYHLSDVDPFQSISELDDEQWTTLCKDLAHRREVDASYNRRFGHSYRAVRLEVEEMLKDEFVSKGGIVTRKAPHYFCLGVSNWWKSFCDHSEVRISLDDIDPRTVSFTYPDSFTSMGILGRFGISHEKKPYHGKVYFLDEIQDVIREFGMPEDRPLSNYSEYHKEDLEIYVEAQLWTDVPIVSCNPNIKHNKTLHTNP